MLIYMQKLRREAPGGPTKLLFIDRNTEDTELQIVDIASFTVGTAIDISAQCVDPGDPSYFAYGWGGIGDESGTAYVTFEGSELGLAKIDVATGSVAWFEFLPGLEFGTVYDAVIAGSHVYVVVEPGSGPAWLNVVRFAIADGAATVLELTDRTRESTYTTGANYLSTDGASLFVNAKATTQREQVEIDLSTFTEVSQRAFSASSPAFIASGQTTIRDGFIYTPGQDVTSTSVAYVERHEIGGSTTYLELESTTSRYALSTAIDDAGAYLFVGNSVGKVFKVDLSTFTVDSSLSMTATGRGVTCLRYADGYLYAVVDGYNSTGEWALVKIDPSSMTASDSIDTQGWFVVSNQSLLVA